MPDFLILALYESFSYCLTYIVIYFLRSVLFPGQRSYEASKPGFSFCLYCVITVLKVVIQRWWRLRLTSAAREMRCTSYAILWLTGCDVERLNTEVGGELKNEVGSAPLSTL